ncbi:MAG: hypothetical protein H8E18_12305 [FCB group bacterium]|nr:hypothetical protein [FCB group bacterium]
MKNSFNHRLISGLIMLCLLAPLMTCDLVTPEEFAEGETSISTFDDRACEFLSRELHPLDTIYSAQDTSVVVDTLYLELNAKMDSFTILLDSLLSDTVFTETSTFASLYDSIANQLDAVVLDTTNLVNYGGNSVYLHFPSAISGEATVFVSWAFDKNNVSDYVSIDLIDRDGNLANIASQDMPLAIVSGCTQEYVADFATAEIANTPVVKTRTTFDLEAIPYLVQVKVTKFIDGTSRVPLRITLLQND